MTPAGAIANSTIAKTLAKQIRHVQKKLDTLRKEEEEKKALIAGKCLALQQLYNKTQSVVVAVEKVSCCERLLELKDVIHIYVNRLLKNAITKPKN